MVGVCSGLSHCSSLILDRFDEGETILRSHQLGLGRSDRDLVPTTSHSPRFLYGGWVYQSVGLQYYCIGL